MEFQVSPIPMSTSAAVVIVTKNRADDLRRAAASALGQTAKPQVVVIDDNSTDATQEMLAREFPQVAVFRSPTSLGCVVQRNRAAHLVPASILFSLDDDAVFSSPAVVERTIREFNHPRVGAVAIPFIDVNTSSEIKQRAPDDGKIYAAYSYIGTAHAIRKDLFLSLGGYREVLVHQGEEEDYCVRLLEAGYITRLGNADPIHHFESPRRNWQRMDLYGSRNKILYAWQNVPFPFLPGHLAVTSVKTLGYSLKPGRFSTRLSGVLEGYSMSFGNSSLRAPVSKQTYQLSRELKRRGAVPLGEIESRLLADRGLSHA